MTCTPCHEFSILWAAVNVNSEKKIIHVTWPLSRCNFLHEMEGHLKAELVMDSEALFLSK